jgi:hypothetical protein
VYGGDDGKSVHNGVLRSQWLSAGANPSPLAPNAVHSAPTS